MSEPGQKSGDVLLNLDTKSDQPRIYDNYFPEGQASYTLAESIKESRLGGGVVDFGRRMFMISVSYLVSGYYQYQGEILKVTGDDAGEDPLKFPGGVADINFAEELIEAGTFAAAGSVGMLYLAKFMRNREGKELSKKDEATAIIAGAFMGNAALSLLGGLAHELAGRPDFPTMEIIQKILGN